MSKKHAIVGIIDALGGTPPSVDASLEYLLESVAEAIEGYEAQPADLSGYAELEGATFTGAVSGIAPTSDANFATKKYVDDSVPDLTGYAALAGATFTGAVSGIDPTADAHLATKKYVDDAIAAAIAGTNEGE